MWARTAVTEHRNLPRSSPAFSTLSPTLPSRSLSTSNPCGYRVLTRHAAVIYATYIYAPAQDQVQWWGGGGVWLYSSLIEGLLILTLVTLLHLYTIWLSSLTMHSWDQHGRCQQALHGMIHLNSWIVHGSTGSALVAATNLASYLFICFIDGRTCHVITTGHVTFYIFSISYIITVFWLRLYNKSSTYSQNGHSIYLTIVTLLPQCPYYDDYIYIRSHFCIFNF